MYNLDQISSTLGDFIDAVFHPSVANLPAGFLVLVFAVLINRRAARGRPREDASGKPGGSRTDRQFVPNLAGDLGDLALTTTAAASGRPRLPANDPRATVRIVRSIALANPRRSRRADATNAESPKNGVAPGRGVRRAGQIAPQRGHIPTSRIGKIDVRETRLRHLLSGAGADTAQQGNRRPSEAHGSEAHGYDSLIVRAVLLARTLYWAHKRAG